MSLPSRKLAAVAALLAACALVPARAELSDEIQVYTDDINEPGQFGLELHVNTTPRGRRTPDYPGEVTPHHGWRFTPEFSYGINKDWEAGLYLPMSRAADGNFQAGGWKLRMKYLPIKPEEGRAGWYLGANAEFSRMKHRFSESASGLELRIMSGWHGEDWLVGFNPVFTWDLSQPLRSGTPALSVQAKVARTIARDVAVGFEYYGDVGTTRRLQLSSQQAQTLYAALDTRFGRFDLNFGVGWGLTRAADDLTVKAIVGFPF